MGEKSIYLVTGGAGFIGSHIADALLRRGERVRIVDDLSTGRAENLNAIRQGFEFVRGDLKDGALARDVMEGVGVVFHQAAIPSVPRSVADPLTTHNACLSATFNVLLAAKDAGVRRFVYAASSSAYGDQPILPKIETMAPAPLSPYAASKLAGENYCRAFTASYGFETVCLRYFNVFGPRQDPSSEYSGVIARFVDALLEGRRPTIYGDGEQSRDFTFVSNVVEANLLAAAAPRAAGRVINVASGRRSTLNELLRTLQKLTGREDLEAVRRDARVGDVRDSLADITLAGELLGYSPRVGLEEGLKATLSWRKAAAGAECLAA